MKLSCLSNFHKPICNRLRDYVTVERQMTNECKNHKKCKVQKILFVGTFIPYRLIKAMHLRPHFPSPPSFCVAAVLEWHALGYSRLYAYDD
jgi:hypothetical protein